MAKLTFQRRDGIIVLTSAAHKVLGVWRGHNRVAIGHQPWPDGTWPYDTYNRHLNCRRRAAAIAGLYVTVADLITRPRGCKYANRVFLH